MKQKILLLGLLFLSYLSIAQQKKILFVGNSYTAGNNLAQLTYNVAESTGNGFIYDSHTPGGQRFLNHAVNTTLETKINAQDWDFVTLQGQSVEVSLTGNVFNTEVVPFVSQLVSKIRTNNTCTQPVFFRTWGRENGLTNCQSYPWICTYEGMDDALAQNYQILAEQNNALLSPVGAVWRYLRNNYPTLDLYTSDGSHPSQIGSYAAAVTFYTVFFNEDPTAVTYNYTLSNTDANAIKAAVKLLVFDAINSYNFSSYFNEVINNSSVDFTYSNINADSYLWDFDDGNSSTAQNPTHIYSAVGDYQVSLTTIRCGNSNTITKTIGITTLSLLDFDAINYKIHPNPTLSTIYIQNIDTSKADISLYNVNGQKVKQFKKGINKISVSDLNDGVYFLKITIGKTFKIKKIIKQ